MRLVRLYEEAKSSLLLLHANYDVVDRLEPDWVFCTDTMEFSRIKESSRPLNSRFIGAALPFEKYLGTITI